MALFSKIFLTIHIISGFISLILFWLPMLSKKGGKLHNQSGRWYVRSMWVVVGSAFILSIKNVVIGAYVPAVFLGFLTVITSGPLWYSIAILDQKKGRSPQFKQSLFYFNSFVVVFAIAMIIYGLNIEGYAKVLMFIFGGLGLTNVPDVLRHLRGVDDNLTWIQEHLIGMITTGIAAYTAFFVFGGQTFFGRIFDQGSLLAIIPWIAPGILGTVANVYFKKKYGPKPTQS